MHGQPLTTHTILKEGNSEIDLEDSGSDMTSFKEMVCLKTESDNCSPFASIKWPDGKRVRKKNNCVTKVGGSIVFNGVFH